MIALGCSERVEYEIKHIAANPARDSIYWINNDTILFVDIATGSKSIFTWNTIENKVQPHRENIDSYICYGGGYITYRSRNTGNGIFYRSGEFPNETEYSANLINKETKLNRYTCNRYLPSEEHKGKLVHYLKEEHGYLLAGDVRDRNENIKYVTNDGNTITLPMVRYEYRKPVRFYQFNDAYYFRTLRDIEGSWGSHCRKIWWLYPEGKMESACIPLIDSIPIGTGAVFPYKYGYLFISDKTSSDMLGRPVPGNSGIYLVNQEMEYEQKLISGHVSYVTTSPNGCRVAFRHKLIVNSHINLTVIDLCSSN